MAPLPHKPFLSWPASERRSLLLWGAGAVLGIAIAGLALFSAKGTQFAGIPAEDAAVVNQKPILTSDVAIQLQQQTGVTLARATPQQRRAVLDAMIREELLVQRGLELDQPGVDPDTRAALVSAVQSQVAVDATSQTPTDAELRRYYTAHRDAYSSIGVMTVHDLVTTDKPPVADAMARLERARAALAQGEPLGAVMARERLQDSGAVKGEELYFAAKLHLGDRLFDAASTLNDGQVSAPISLPDRAHLLVMQKNQRPQPRPFDLARNQVYSDYKQALQKTMEEGEYRYLRDKSDIKIAPDFKG